MITECIDERGFRYVVALPDNTPPEYICFGAVLGPPDLSELGLVAADLMKLHNGLVERGVFNGDTLNRGVIRQLLKDLDISLNERWVTAVFVKEFF